MRQRLAIWFVLPCLVLAWPSVAGRRAQVSGCWLRRSRAAVPAGAKQRPGEAPAGRSTAARRSRQPADGKPPLQRRPKLPRRPPPSRNSTNGTTRIPTQCAVQEGDSSPGPSCLLILLLILIWVKSADWVNRDTQIFDLGYGKWNPILFFPFLAILLLFAFPVLVGFANFWLAFGLLVRVLPGDVHSVRADAEQSGRSCIKRYSRPIGSATSSPSLPSKVGIKMEGERKAEYEKGAKVDLMAIGSPDERDNQANLITARQSPGYLLVKELIADMVDRRSDRAILDYTQQAVVARQHIDGVWHNGEARDRESGDVMLAVMKTLANSNATERRKKQEGKFAAKYDGPFVCLPDRQPGRADRRARRAATSRRLSADIQEIRRLGHAAEAGRAVGRPDGHATKACW